MNFCPLFLRTTLFFFAVFLQATERSQLPQTNLLHVCLPYFDEQQNGEITALDTLHPTAPVDLQPTPMVTETNEAEQPRFFSTAIHTFVDVVAGTTIGCSFLFVLQIFKIKYDFL